MTKKLFKSAILFTLVGLIVKILSAIYKIPYQNIVGDDGLYVFQQVYPFYAIIAVGSIYAFPVVIANIFSSKNYNKNYNFLEITSSAITSLCIILIPIGLMFSIFSTRIAQVLGDELLAPLILTYLPITILVVVISVTRGIFLSNEETINKVSISMIIEQIFRVLIIFVGIYFYTKTSDIYFTGTISINGFFVGMISSSIYLIISLPKRKYFSYKSINFKLAKKISLSLIMLLICVTIIQLLQLIDSITVYNLLNNNNENSHSKVIKGIYDRGLPIIQVGIFFVGPVISSLIPSINKRDSDMRDNSLKNIFQIIIFFAMPITVGAIIIIEPLMIMLFKTSEYINTFRILMISIVLYSQVLLTSSIIQKDKVNLLFGTICFGVFCKVILNLVLIPNYELDGAAISTVISLFTIFIINFILIKGWKYFDISFIIKNIISIILMALILVYIMTYIPMNIISRTEATLFTFLLILCGGIMYFAVNLLLKTIDVKQIKYIWKDEFHD